MKKRESEFPNRVTAIRSASSTRPVISGRRFSRWFFWLLLALFLGLALFANYPLFLEDAWQRVESRLLGTASDDKIEVSRNRFDQPAKPVKQAPDKPEVPDSVPSRASERAHVVVAPGHPRVVANAIDIPVSISIGFRPVGFKIAARQGSVVLSDSPLPLMRRLPRFRGRHQKYTALELSRGQLYLMVLDIHDDGNLLYVDMNRNGDFRDDGEPLSNRGKGPFAAQLDLSLANVSGVNALKGEYKLWIFSNESAWRKNRLRYYSMTQLGGQLRLEGQLIDAFLADNKVIDGDYRNDGIYLDLNANGRIESGGEFVPPGEKLRIGKNSYSFSVRY